MYARDACLREYAAEFFDRRYLVTHPHVAETYDPWSRYHRSFHLWNQMSTPFTSNIVGKSFRDYDKSVYELNCQIDIKGWSNRFNSFVSKNFEIIQYFSWKKCPYDYFLTRSKFAGIKFASYREISIFFLWIKSSSEKIYTTARLEQESFERERERDIKRTRITAGSCFWTIPRLPCFQHNVYTYLRSRPPLRSP